jgi:hypothetical protein
MLSLHLPTGIWESHENLSQQINIKYSSDTGMSNSVEQIPPLEADSSSANQEIPQDPATCPCPESPMATCMT